jgi:hypothetical protein
MAGIADRSTRQTITATLDRAAARGNQAVAVRGQTGLGLWTDPPQRMRNRPLTRENAYISQGRECGARFPALRRP